MLYNYDVKYIEKLRIKQVADFGIPLLLIKNRDGIGETYFLN